MTTTREIVHRALTKIGVIDMGDAAPADEATHALDALNAMMHGWKLRGVDLTHTDLAMGDTFSLASEYEEGTVYLLAARLSPDFQAPAGFDADDWFRAFQAAYRQANTVTMPPGLLNMPSQKFRRIN
ncbi:MAG: hypothetical protein EBT13_09060 [Rhodobacteraceae bacterium]|nr:hypothetical protein [Paracoccaceae bacterium]